MQMRLYFWQFKLTGATESLIFNAGREILMCLNKDFLNVNDWFESIFTFIIFAYTKVEEVK